MNAPTDKKPKKPYKLRIVIPLVNDDDGRREVREITSSFKTREARNRVALEWLSSGRVMLQAWDVEPPTTEGPEPPSAPSSTRTDATNDPAWRWN